MRELQEGWIETDLEHLLSCLESGNRPRGGVKGISEGIPSLGGEHLTYSGGFNFSRIRFVPLEFASAMNKGRIRRHDILIVKDGATTGKTAFVCDNFPYENAVVNEHVFLLRIREGIDPKFVFNFLRSKEGQKRILDNFQGSAQGGINRTFAPNVKIPLAPLREQHRIVAKLDELLPKVDACKQRLEKIPTILKRFRQSVLAAALSGVLTKDWRREQKIVDEDSEALPKTWMTVTLREVVEKFNYGSSAKSDKTGEIPVLRMGNIQNGEIDWTDLAYSNDEDEVKKYLLAKNTVLFNRTNSPELVGKTAIYRGERPAMFAGYLIRLIPGPKIDAEFLNLCLNAPIARVWCREVKTDGVSQSNINAQKLADFEIPLPPLEEQKVIVQQIREQLLKVDKTLIGAEKALKYVARASEAILSKAFSGGLVEQDPSDEPASKLLERLKSSAVEKPKKAAPKKRKLDKAEQLLSA